MLNGFNVCSLPSTLLRQTCVGSVTLVVGTLVRRKIETIGREVEEADVEVDNFCARGVAGTDRVEMRTDLEIGVVERVPVRLVWRGVAGKD